MLNPHTQRGFSLVEVLLALALGLFLISSTMGLYAATFGTHARLMKQARLGHDLRAIMAFITRDLRRAGYNGAAVAGAANPFSGISLNGTDSISLSYDADSDGIQDVNEHYGYRYRNESVQMTANGGNTWENLSDPQQIRITQFAIEDVSPGVLSVGTAPVLDMQTRAFVITLAGEVKRQGETWTLRLSQQVQVRNISG